MQHILHGILRKNKKEVDGEEYISRTLLNFLANFQSIDGLETRDIGHEEFIKIESIPRDLRNELGLFQKIKFQISKEAYAKGLKSENLRDSDTKDTVKNEERDPQHNVLPEWDVEKAIARADGLAYEFVDHFSDSELIQRKSLTLSSLKETTPYMHNKRYMKSVYTIVENKNLDCDLRFDDFKKFYNRLRWYLKVGLTNGCLTLNPNEV